MSFILFILGVGIVIDIALNLWILSLLDEIIKSDKKQECAWTIKFDNGGFIVGEAEKQQEEEQEK